MIEKANNDILFDIHNQMSMALQKGGYFIVITMYLCFLAGGLVLPVISTLFGFFGEGIDSDVTSDIDMDVDMDVDMDTDIDIDPAIDGVFSIALFPTSLMSLSALAITFGAVGGVMTLTEKGRSITLIAAIISGYLASVIVQTLIRALKKVQTRSYGVEEKELLLYDGKIIDAILPGQLGTVSFTTLKNVLVSYPAKCADDKIKLEPGRLVKAIELKDGIVFVEAKNKYE